MTNRLKILILILLTWNTCFGQQFNPCQLTSGTQYGDTIIKFYPNCDDTTTFTLRRYSTDGVIWRNESYKNSVQHGISWFTHSQDDGTQSHIYQNGIETERIDYHPNSGVPKFTKQFVNDSLVYINNFFPSGNPKSLGYSILALTGEHKQGTWVEYDSIGYSYWIGDYSQIYILHSDTIDDGIGMIEIKYSSTHELKNGIWIQYDSNGIKKDSLLYFDGAIIRNKRIIRKNR